MQQALDVLLSTAEMLGVTVEGALRDHRSSAMLPRLGDAGGAGSLAKEKSDFLGRHRSAEILDDLSEQMERAGPASSTTQNDGCASASTEAAGSISGGSAPAGRISEPGEGGAVSQDASKLTALECELEAVALERDVALVITPNHDDPKP
jgi:hypothetical protein